MKFYEFPIYYHYMVIYSTTNDKPVLGEMWKWDFDETWQKGILCITPKNSSSCVSVEYPSQANPANPHFFGSHPPLDIFWRVVYNYFCCYFILAFGRRLYLMKILKFIIMLLRKIEKILHSGRWKICTGGVRAFALPLTIHGAKPFHNLIFPLLAKPTTRGNENNSHLILFPVLLVRNILQQRGHFICKSFAFALYYLLYYIANSKVLLFANNYYLRCVVIWISLLFEYHNHLNIISI